MSDVQLDGVIIPVSVVQNAVNDFQNAFTNQPISLPKGATVTIPCALFIAAIAAYTDANGVLQSPTFVNDLSNLATADLVLCGPGTGGDPASGPVLYRQSIPATQFSAGLTYAQWAAFAGAHFTFSIPSAYTNQAPAGNYYLAIGVTPAGSSGGLPLARCTNVSIVDYGLYTAGVAIPPSGVAYDEATSDARYQSQVQAAINRVFQSQVAALLGNTTNSAGAPTSVDAIPTLPASPVAKPQYSKIEVYLRTGSNRLQAFILDALGSATPDGATIITPADQAAAVAAGTFTATPLAWFLQG